LDESFYSIFCIYWFINNIKQRRTDFTSGMKNAVCLLTKTPNVIWFDFLKGFTNYDIYVIIDDNSIDYGRIFSFLYKNIKIIQIDNQICYDHGYKNCNSAVGFPEVISWDKAMYLFCEIICIHEHIWFIEDDVFLNNERVLTTIDNNYPSSDLLTAFHETNVTGDVRTGWNHWVNVIDRIEPPWSHSMVCACRISRPLFEKIKEYNKQKGHLFFIEAMFNTIANQNGLRIDNPPQLSTIHWNTKWDVKKIDIDKLYHPIKRIIEHTYIRESVSSQSDGLCLVPPS